MFWGLFSPPLDSLSSGENGKEFANCSVYVISKSQVSWEATLVGSLRSSEDLETVLGRSRFQNLQGSLNMVTTLGNSLLQYGIEEPSG